jgi:hypothetical protein
MSTIKKRIMRVPGNVERMVRWKRVWRHSQAIRENIAGNGAQPAIREQERSDTVTGKQKGA